MEIFPGKQNRHTSVLYSKLYWYEDSALIRHIKSYIVTQQNTLNYSFRKSHRDCLGTDSPYPILSERFWALHVGLSSSNLSKYATKAYLVGFWHLSLPGQRQRQMLEQRIVEKGIPVKYIENKLKCYFPSTEPADYGSIELREAELRSVVSSL